MAPRASSIKSSFNRGSIIRINLENFMTYDSLEVFLGPHLNMVLGPNGTGKSAIVCSIIVGLAGDVGLTGRANNVSDLVKNGKSFGRTEIELFNPSGINHIIERHITIMKKTQYKTESKSDWKLNGRNAQQKEVRDFIRELNIKVDNLCQFLPQDSVTQFVKMNATELLLNTLKATGDSDLVESHEKLVEHTKTISELEIELEQLSSALENEQIALDRLRSDVKRVEERDSLKNELNLIKQKRVYLNYIEKKKTVDRVKARQHEIVKQIEALKSKSLPAEQALNDAKKDLKKFREVVEISARELRTHRSHIVGCHTKIDDLSVASRDAYSEYKDKQNESKEREQSIRITEGEIQSMEAQLASLTDVDCSSQLVRLMSQIDAKKEELRKYPRERQELVSQARLHNNTMEQIKEEKRQIESVAEKKIEFLRSNHASTAKAADWLSKNSSRFSKKIYRPMICEIDVTELKYAKHIESALPKSDLIAFVCEDQNDLRLFTRCMREELRINVNIILAPQKDPDEYITITRQMDLSAYGVVGCLKDFVTAPRPILSYLCGANHFHLVPIADNPSEAQINRLLDLVPRFYVGSDIYVRSQSRYDRETIITKDRIKEARFLRWSVDRKRIEQCRQRFVAVRDKKVAVDQEIEKITDLEQTVRSEWQAIVERHGQLKAKHEERKVLQQKIGLKRSNLEKVRSKIIDMNAEKEKLQEAIKEINLSYPKLLEKLCESHSRCVTASANLIENKILVKVANNNVCIADKNLSDSKLRTTELDDELESVRRELATKQEELSNIINLTSKQIDGFTSKGLPPNVDKKMKKLPDDDEKLSERELVIENRINSLWTAGNNRNLLSDFRKAQDEQLEKRRRKEQLQSQIELEIESRDTIKQNWLEKLTDMISVINTEYHLFMTQLNYDGEVSLDVPDGDVNDFLHYGIQIKVRYRSGEDLIPLTSMRQSGGERSVATMIYMLALQTVTSVPFRCVDEINQGMDKDNERKVFELIVKTADASASQYFLISPKLLPDLPYSDKMKIHIVFNGPHCEIDWNQMKRVSRAQS